jgi:hypothetical protein
MAAGSSASGSRVTAQPASAEDLRKLYMGGQ